jgi:uncharacterized protein
MSRLSYDNLKPVARACGLLHFVFLVCIVLLSARARAMEPPPFNVQHKLVTDYTGTLKPEQQTQLQRKLEEIERTDGTQIAVLVIPTLQGDELFDFTHRTFMKWGVGQKDKNNGVLFLIVKNDKQMRIHVGYGLEGRLTDLESDQILRNTVRPAFKNGRFYEGIDAGTSAIVQAVKGEYKAPPQSVAPEESWVPIIFFIIFMLILMSQVRNGRRNLRRARRSGWHVGTGSWRGGGFGGGGGGGGFGGGGGSFGGGSSGGGGASSSW